MKRTSAIHKIGNFFTTSILRSKLHSPLSNSTLVISLTGRTSGERISTPVNYVEKNGVIFLTSQKDRTWWRNLRGGAPVTLRLKGKDLDGWADVKETPDEVAAGIRLFISSSGAYARHYGLTLDEEGNPDPERLNEITSDRVIVVVKLP
jgi:hypothetical protein